MIHPKYHAIVIVATDTVRWSGDADPDYFARWCNRGTVPGRGDTDEAAIEHAYELAAAARTAARKADD